MNIYKDGKILRVDFASVSDIIDASQQPLKLVVNQDRKAHYFRNRIAPDWFGIASTEAVIEAVNKSYAEGAEKIRALHDSVSVKLPRAVWSGRKRVRGDDGDDLNIEAVHRGELDRAWTKSVRRVKHGASAITLYVDIGANYMTRSDELQWRGLAGVALARIMEAAGYSVEIVAGFHIAKYAVVRGCPPAIISVRVKPRNARADDATLASTVALPGFFRTYGFFGIIAAADYLESVADDNLGSVAPLANPGMVKTDSRTMPVIMPANIGNESTAVDWIKETVELLQHSTIDRG